MSQKTRSIAAVTVSISIAVLASARPAAADVRLPHIFAEHMVVQRDMPIAIWGFADLGERVTVKLGPNQATAKADTALGNWLVKLPPMSAGGPYRMTVTAENTIELTDILVGEVWLCSGQSNMQMRVKDSKNAAAEIAAADYPEIRSFDVLQLATGLPVSDVQGVWRICKPQNVEQFSAVAYFFGREIHSRLGVPVGLVNSSWDGTRIEPWTPPEGFAAVPELQHISKNVEQINAHYRKQLADSVDQIDAWLADIRKALAHGQPLAAVPIPNHPLSDRQQPTSLYNGMIHPLVPLAIRGAIWYQGEANVGEAMAYHHKMKALISGWRKVWDQGEFPFYFVQLAPYRYGRQMPLRLPQLWEAQSASLAIPNTGMAVTIDIGESDDIHPKNKQDVGKRLALWALAKTYGHADLVYSGPLYKSMAIEGGKIRISFDHVGDALKSRNGKPLTWFQVAGDDKAFVGANAIIDGKTVLVASEKVAKPVAARFGWHRLARPNLTNDQGLPAAPFRTDRW